MSRCFVFGIYVNILNNGRDTSEVTNKDVKLLTQICIVLPLIVYYDKLVEWTHI